jgi:hypothetical protein
MITKATVRFKSTSVYQQGRHVTADKKPKETPDDYEKRTWRERAHANEHGELFIPPMAFKNCLSSTAKFMGMQIRGQGKATYTKHFEAGVLVIEPLMLGIQKDEVPGVTVYVPADGRRQGNKRVDRTFPTINQWAGDVVFLIVDPAITQDVFEAHVTEMGRYIGIGVFRPQNNGYNGRFEVVSVKWEEGA